MSEAVLWPTQQSYSLLNCLKTAIFDTVLLLNLPLLYYAPAFRMPCFTLLAGSGSKESGYCTNLSAQVCQLSCQIWTLFGYKMQWLICCARAQKIIGALTS